MVFDTGSIAFLRNPWGDESLVDIVQAATICSDDDRIMSIMRYAEMPEMKVDLLYPADDLLLYFQRFNFNLLVMPTELLGEDFFAELTLRLTEQPFDLPFLVIIGSDPAPTVQNLIECYKKCLHIEGNNNAVCGERIRRFINREIMTLNEMTSRLRKCTSVTLKAMHIKNEDAFDYLLDETTEVLENSFVFFHSINDLHFLAAKRRNIDPEIIIETVDTATELAIKTMTSDEFAECFNCYNLHDNQPSTAEFIFTAARITSLYCSRIIRHIHILKYSKNTSLPEN